MLRKTILESDVFLKDPGQTSNINERAKYTASTSIPLISVGNTNLSGTGAATIFAASSNGALIKSFTIQAITNTTKGMIRLYFGNAGATFYLLDEFEVPAVTRSATVPAFSATYELDFFLQPSLRLLATTQLSQSFVLQVQGLNFAY